MNWENPNTKIKREETEEGRCYSTRQLFACFLLSRLRHYLRPGTGYPITSTENSVSRTGSCSYDALNRDGSRGKVQGVRTPPEMTCGLIFFSALKFVYVTSQLWLVQPLLRKIIRDDIRVRLKKWDPITQKRVNIRKILDPPLLRLPWSCVHSVRTRPSN